MKRFKFAALLIAVLTVLSFTASSARAGMADPPPPSSGDGSGQTGSLDPNAQLDPSEPVPAEWPDGVWDPATNLDTTLNALPNICMFVNGDYCQDADGPDNPFTVENNALSNLTASHAGSCDYCYTIAVVSTGRCQFGSSNNFLELSTAGCDSSQAREVIEAFTRTDNGVVRWSFYNTGRNNWYGTNGPDQGYRIFVESVHAGFYTGWCIQSGSGSC